jgi:hypothetical protein
LSSPIGILTHDIRTNWSNIDNRLDAIIDLCKQINKVEWVQEIENNLEDIYYDGRWFRSWDGPYADLDCTPETVGHDLYDKYYHLLSNFDD